ncbi:MAG: radical SAM protein [Chloroflexi bacterium]|nr:radical SAM protein [Chloroflexota bacterium]
MANLVISGVCALRCPYCFAEEHLAALKARAVPLFISPEIFEQRLDFLQRSGIPEARLIGGEPTLHPQFAQLVARAVARGFKVMVFSHGLMPERALAALEALPLQQCTVLVNMNATRYPADTARRDKEHARRAETLRRLGGRALPGFTIYTPDFDLDPLLAAINSTGCQQMIRLGVAQAIFAGHNQYIHPKQYPYIAHKIARFAVKAAQAGVTISFDCGFVPCMFSDADLAVLRRVKADAQWHCSPILDIDIDGRVVHCFPLTGTAQTTLESTADAASLRAALAEQSAPYRMAGIYRDCATCALKASGACAGGCLAMTLRRFQQTPFQVTPPAERSTV